MKRRWRLLLVLGPVLLVGGLLLIPSVHWPLYGWLRGEAFYQGMPTSYWRVRLREHTEVVRPQTIEGPWIVKLMADVGVPVSVTKPRERPAILGMDPIAASVLAELLTDGDERIVLAACDHIGNLGMDAQAAVPALLQMLKHPMIHYRQHAVYALYNITPADAVTLSSLIQSLDDHDPWVAYYAALALGRLGGNAKAAVPAILELLQSKRAHTVVFMPDGETIGSGAIVALWQIDPEAAATVGVK